MAVEVSVIEEAAVVTPSVDVISLSITEPSVEVSVVDERVDVSVVENNISVSFENDKIDVSVVEQAVQVIVTEASDTPPPTVEEELYDIEIDTSVANITYVGQALPGTSSSTPAWRIKRITETVTGSSVDWADGAAEFVHAWDDHLTLTYGP